MSEGLSEYQKDKFLKYLHDRLAKKKSEKSKYTNLDRPYDLLKTEIAELKVIKFAFKDIINKGENEQRAMNKLEQGMDNLGLLIDSSGHVFNG